MTVKELIESNKFKVIKEAEDSNRTISTTFNCDLLSIAMSKAPSDCAWVTVMGNINTLAVASLADVACIVLAEGVTLDDAAAQKLNEQDITVFATEKSIFEASLEIYNLINA